MKTQIKTIVIRLIINKNNSHIKFYSTGQTFLIQILNKEQLKVWYLNFYILRYIYNSYEKFVNFQPKTYKFIIINKEIMKLKQVKTIILFFQEQLRTNTF